LKGFKDKGMYCLQANEQSFIFQHFINDIEKLCEESIKMFPVYLGTKSYLWNEN